MPGEFDFISWIRAQQRTSELFSSRGNDLRSKMEGDDLLLWDGSGLTEAFRFESAFTARLEKV